MAGNKYGGLSIASTSSATDSLLTDLNTLTSKLHDYNKIQIDAETDLQKRRVNNLEDLYRLRKQYANKGALEEETINNKAAERMIKFGIEQNRQKWEAIKQQAYEAKLAEAEAQAKADKKASGKSKTGRLTKEEQAAIAARVKAELDAEDTVANKKLKNIEKREKRLKLAAAHELTDAKAKQDETEIFGKGRTITERLSTISSMFKDEEGNASIQKGLTESLAIFADLTKQLNNTIDTIGNYKGKIDTRLQGSKWETDRTGSYWNLISKDITGAAGISPLVKQADIVKKVDELVSKGIAYNVEQRAFLATVSDKIATTFNAADSTLLRLVRLQQQDSTAARLGMESAMTAFLNNMYETTEYLTDVAATVRSNLYEAQTFMEAEEAVEFEYQVQKWLGSLYSVGMSDTAVQSIANTLGKISAGDISGVNGEGTSNLLVMAANQANMSIADALTDGLDASETNTLMQAMVNYLADLYEESKDSRVVQQQIAKVFGLNASDLKAVTNLVDQNSTTIENITNNNLTYGGAMTQLTTMANSMYSRTSLTELMNNAWENVQYSMAAGIANNPLLLGVYKVANLLDDVAGGINFSIPLVMGTGTAQTFNVSDIMLSGALSSGILSSLAQMLVSGGAGGVTGNGLLTAFGVGNTASVSRGTGSGLLRSLTSGMTVSSSGYAGNASSGDVYHKTMTDTTDSTKSQVAEASESEDAEVTNRVINESIVNIYTLLQNVVDGTLSLKVDMGNELAWTTAIRSGNSLFGI